MSDIRVILSTGSLYLFDTALVFDMAAEAGFDGIEVMCDERYTTREPAYLCKLSADYHIPIPTLHSPFIGRLPGWANTATELGRIQNTLELADKVGAERIVVHLPFKIGRLVLSTARGHITLPWRSPFADFKTYIENGGLADLQRQTSVQICIENLPAKHFLGEPRDIVWWNSIAEWSKIHDYLTLDTTHCGTFGIDPLEALRAGGNRVKHIHLSNYQNGQEHRLPQSGDLDLAAFLRELATTNFDGTVSVELHPDALAFDTPQVTRQKLRETLNFCRQHLN